LPHDFESKKSIDCYQRHRNAFKVFQIWDAVAIRIGPMCLWYLYRHHTDYVRCLVLQSPLWCHVYCVRSLGTASILGRKKVQTAVKLVGSFVMILFGVNVISEAFGQSFLPGITLFSATSDKNLFVQGLL
jgi:hypothetical protein